MVCPRGIPTSFKALSSNVLISTFRIPFYPWLATYKLCKLLEGLEDGK